MTIQERLMAAQEVSREFRDKAVTEWGMRESDHDFQHILVGMMSAEIASLRERLAMAQRAYAERVGSL